MFLVLAPLLFIVLPSPSNVIRGLGLDLATYAARPVQSRFATE
jgi:hypothetical protein